MLAHCETSYLEQAVCSILQERPKINLLPSVETGVYVGFREGDAWIGAETKSYYTRGLTLLFQNLSAGNSCFEICQQPSYQSTGLLLEDGMASPSVMYALELLVCLGLNMLVLRVEKNIASRRAIQQLIPFAGRLGVELVPYIHQAGELEFLLPSLENGGSIRRLLLEEDAADKLCILCKAAGLTPLFRNRSSFTFPDCEGVSLERCGANMLYLPIHREEELFSRSFFDRLSVLSEASYRGESFTGANAAAMADYLKERAVQPLQIKS